LGRPVKPLTVDKRIDLVYDGDFTYPRVPGFSPDPDFPDPRTPFLLAMLGAPIEDHEKRAVEAACRGYGLGTEVASEVAKVAWALLPRIAAAGGMWTLPDRLASTEISDAALEMAWRAGRIVFRLPPTTPYAQAISSTRRWSG
jgi:hypothetical protein